MFRWTGRVGYLRESSMEKQAGYYHRRGFPGVSSMRDSIDLGGYLRRIGLLSAESPDLQTLRALVAAHAATIPFENLNPFLGLPVDLELAAVERKLVQDGRGGYCFEQNLLLGEALRAIGFEVTNLAARVLWNQPADAITARSHMLLRVELEDRSWLVDVGFGGMTLTGVLQLEQRLEQVTPHEPFRLLECDGDWYMQARLPAGWKTLYRFDLQQQYPIDYLASNYFLSTHPDSHFVTGLTAARAEPGRRLALRNREFALHTANGETTRRMLRSATEIREVLENDFLIRLPPHPELDRRLDSLPAVEADATL
ncbi:N-hydroxyarylamine O-acetyltransferase [Rhodanobacter sp. MP7CTX1]|nr:N-hydroxyarylamine O-acetyltransferase [Rhodanobacter sp. MP7CTX1]